MYLLFHPQHKAPIACFNFSKLENREMNNRKTRPTICSKQECKNVVTSLIEYVGSSTSTPRKNKTIGREQAA